MTHEPKTALVLGATGALGRQVAQKLLDRGWAVRALARDVDAARRALPDPRVTWIAGDAMQKADIAMAAAGCAALFHGANPRKYANWRGLALPMLANAIEAAQQAGARLVFPGNIYNFGPDAWPLLREDAPQHPATRKGAVRAEMEALLRDASHNGLRCLIVRAGDFFGPGYTDSWLGQVIVKGGRNATAIRTLGPDDVGHAWAYLPDLAESFARLLEREAELPDFARFHFAGHWIGANADFVAALRSAAGKPELPAKRFFWPLVYIAAPFAGFMREVIEMRYLWSQPIRLDNAALRAFLGDEPHTPLVEALATSLPA